MVLLKAVEAFDDAQEVDKTVNRWDELAKMCNSTTERVKEVMIAEDPPKIIPAIREFLSGVDDHHKKSVYIGVTASNTPKLRAADHRRQHGFYFVPVKLIAISANKKSISIR